MCGGVAVGGKRGWALRVSRLRTPPLPKMLALDLTYYVKVHPVPAPTAELKDEESGVFVPGRCNHMNSQV